MSMAVDHISCTGCDYKGVKQYRPLSLIYCFPDGTKVNAGRIIGWCGQCKKIKDIEPTFSAHEIRANIAVLERKARSPALFIGRALGEMLGGRGGKDDKEELASLRDHLRIAEARRSMPRCLTCGSDKTQYVSFNVGGLSENFIHDCGGRLRVEPQDLAAPSFSYRPESICLDVEGRRLDSAQPHIHGRPESVKLGTDREMEVKLASTYPRALAGLQQLIMDAEDCAEAYTIGEGALDAAIEKFMATIGACVHGLVEDGAATNPDDIGPVMEALNLAMWRCELTYKANWPTAFQFWKDWYAQFRRKHSGS